MAWNTEEILRRLDEVVNTRDHASARKAKELLDYVKSPRSKLAPAVAEAAEPLDKPEAAEYQTSSR